MTSGLRKAHKYIWLSIAIGIPVLILFSIRGLDVFALTNNTATPFKVSKSSVLKIAEDDLIKASIIKIDSTYSIEIILKSTLKNPSSLVYTLDSNANKETIIGQLTTVGVYNFKTKAALKGIIIYDALKEKLISKLEF